MKRYLCMIIVFMTFAFLTSSVSYAHSGRTDGNGGHRDNKNKSGLGYYHYHCGGNPAHLHTNGCQYDNSTKDKGNINIITEKEIQQSKENGFNDGINNNYNNTYDNKKLNDSYLKGYREGHSKYIEKKKNEYIDLAIKDCENKNDKRVFDKDVDKKYIDIYNSKYNDIKGKEYKAKGVYDGLVNNLCESIPKDYISMYDIGLKEGKNKRDNILKVYYNKGLSGENMVIDKEYVNITKDIEDAYKTGKRDSESNTNNSILVGIGVVSSIIITMIIKKNKNKQK